MTSPDAARLSELQSALVRALGPNSVITDAAERANYCRDWHGDVTMDAVAILRPDCTEAVSRAVQTCARLGLAIVPQGGNTGLVLGAIPDDAHGQVVLSLSRMNRVRRIDADDFSMVVDAGCVLQHLHEAADAADMFLGLSLGAKGSCQIGGNISTNAGGINVLRYGMARDQVLGLEVVLPDGSVLDALGTLRKDNRGLDVKQLFIGAEGILGVVTGVALKLYPRPTQVETALLGVDSLQAAIELYRRARRDCCDLMTAFEFMPPAAFTLAREAMPRLTSPIAMDHPGYVLVELSGSGLVDIRDLLDRFLEGVMVDGLVRDGVVAASRAQADHIWKFREVMIEGQALRGLHLRTDVSVSLSQLATFVEQAESALRSAFPDCMTVTYGHVGDGNVHINVLPPAGMDVASRGQVIHGAKDCINAVVDAFQGSISAEHGIGRLKRAEFEARISMPRRQLLSAIKRAIDPDGLLNPNCQLDQEAGQAARAAMSTS
ncbi:FAD-binding oxidoreductase [Bordetella sp. 15P40C-2]|uniref:FAD-binding oxidoreductase n=1 Tax=Bordetella sp. 15P40C-2 TaxID=2572246 RepID=UPI0013279F3D|nr:FAD-binding oxidoreductase [Bordetella sp. 15P40C-2]MVW70100.1 FAD-binding protein [Bordetella sp. 15P40C-2]